MLFKDSSKSEAIKCGDTAPDFVLPNQDGKQIALHDVLKRGPVVIFFYPKDQTPGCTKQACTFRDNIESFEKKGVSVLGISSDSVESHARFSNKHGFNFDILSDKNGQIRQAFGVAKSLGLLPGRVTYVLDKQGVVQNIIGGQLKAEQHIPRALEAIEQIAS